MRLVLLALAATLVAGCISPPVEESAASSTVEPGPPGRGTMTAEERVEESSGVEPSTGVSLPAFYAARVHTVEGEITLDRLPVAIATFDGPIAASTGPEGTWRLVASFRATGLSPEAAQADLDAITFAWSHEGPGGHHLEATAERGESAAGVPMVSVGGRSAAFTLELPAALLVDLSLQTSDGDVAVSGFRAGAVNVQTSDGNVAVSGVEARVVNAQTSDGDVALSGVRAPQVNVQTSDGDVALSRLASAVVNAQTSDGNVVADVEPTGSGAITATTTDGDVRVRVPEGASFGYSAELSTTNGDARVGLRDGDAHVEGRDGRSSATFETDGLSRRAIRVAVSLTTTDGDVALEPSSG